MTDPTATGLQVRLAVPADYQAAGEVTVRAYASDGFVDPDHGYVERLRDTASRATEAELWVAVDPTGVVGTVTYCPAGSGYRERAGPDEGEFRMLAVDPRARGRGAARLLVSQCLIRAREDGFAGMVLCSLPEMTSAHALYRSLGFARVESRDWQPVEGVVLWAFALSFAPTP